MRKPRSAAAFGLLALVLTGCTSSGSPAPPSTIISTQTLTRPAPTPTPVVIKPFALALADSPAQPPGQPLPAGEVDRSCPYIKAGLNIEPAAAGEANFADAEGSRVQRVTVLTALKPVGCRFFFFSDYHPIGDILPSTYPSAVEAHNAMVLTAETGTGAAGVANFVPGVDGISFRTRLNAPDDGQDWAFAFAKGTVMVVVRTDQTRTSQNAVDIAQAIVDKF